MSDFIRPRSPREVMCGWAHLPRYIDKIRLHLAGRLHEGYLPFLGKNSDGMWLKAAGTTHEQMLEVVGQTITDGEVCDWVRLNIHRSDAEKAEHRSAMLDYPPADDSEAVAFFQTRKAVYGLAHRDDIRHRADLIDADEGRF